MIYVTHDDGTKDLSSAFEFGEPVALSYRNYPLYSDTAALLDEIRDKVKDFNPKEDHLLLIGDPILIGIAITYVSECTGGIVPCLKWNRRSRSYIPVTLKLGGK